jgi:hypothetical protein
MGVQQMSKTPGPYRERGRDLSRPLLGQAKPGQSQSEGGASFGDENIAEGESFQLPRFELPPDELETIFPGAPDGVRRGLTLATAILATTALTANMAKGADPVGRAVKRFMEDSRAPNA